MGDPSASFVAYSPIDGALLAGGDLGLAYTTTPMAPTPTWTYFDNMGGPTNAVRAALSSPTDPNTIWASTDAIVAKTTMHGMGNFAWNIEAAARWSTKMRMAPLDGKTLYLGTDDGVLKTITGGE